MNSDALVDGVHRIAEQIGEGGTGETHAQRQAQPSDVIRKLEKKDLDPKTVPSILEAQDMPVPGGVAALKLAKPGTDRSRFDAEWQYLMCLHHPNVINVYGRGVWRGRPY